MKFQHKLLALTLSASLTLIGCTTIDPYTGETKVKKTFIGGVFGAGAGAVIAMATGSKEDRVENAIKGGVIGGIAGGAVGAYMDSQEKKMTEKLAGTGVSVTRNGDDIILNMPGDITFASSESKLNPAFTNTLDGVILVLEEFEKTIIMIKGHTDSKGDEQYNQNLSEQRALSVAQYLVDNRIITERVTAIGHGELSSKYDNTTEEGRAQNRRVELILTPLIKQ
ncbi:MAG: OmpA family protein [Saccharospirillaceae bacterium]|nr:OmpA family protein [Pseudomonadales bacterium]NRB80772.1 OmpA family protein [Saccharospirillaceae bacterium]